MEGFANQISIGKETAWGTAVTPTLSVPVSPSDGLQIETNLTGVEAIKTTAPKNKAFYLGQRMFTGGYEFAMYPKFITYFLKSFFGSDTVTEPEAGVVYKHTFAESTSQLALTVEQKIGSIIRRYAGYVVKNFKISGKVGDLINMTVDGLAKTQATASAITASYDTTRPFTWADITEFSIAGTDIKSKVEEFELEVDNGLEVFHGLGALEASAKYLKQSEVKGSFTCYVDSYTAAYLTDLINATEAELIIEITGASIGASSNDILKLTMSKCAFSKVETKLDFDYNALSIEFEAREDATNGLIKTELTNTQATI